MPKYRELVRATRKEKVTHEEWQQERSRQGMEEAWSTRDPEQVWTKMARAAENLLADGDQSGASRTRMLHPTRAQQMARRPDSQRETPLAPDPHH